MNTPSTHKLWIALLVASGACKGGQAAGNGEESTGAEHTGAVACGAAMCAEGQICCNPSCGICTPPDGMCTQQFCDAPAGAEGAAPSGEPGSTCDNVRCVAGTHCEMTQVQCIKAPCPPVPECRPDADAGS